MIHGMRDARIVGIAVDRTVKDIGALPLGSALRMDERQIMRMAAHHTLQADREEPRDPEDV